MTPNNDFQPMETAPKDGSPISIRFKVYNEDKQKEVICQHCGWTSVNGRPKTWVRFDGSWYFEAVGMVGAEYWEPQGWKSNQG